MDPILQMFLSWQFIVFSLAVASIIFVVRTAVEFFIKKAKPAVISFWRELLLPILPVFVGGAAAFFIKAYPYPNDLTSSGSRILFGVVSGLLSGLLYRVIKSLVAQKMQGAANNVTNVNVVENVPESTENPDAPSGN